MISLLSKFGWWPVGIGAAIIASSSFYGGYKIASNACDAEKIEAVTRAIKQANEQAAIDAEIYRDHVRVIADTEIVYREIENDIETVTVSDCTDLGADWVRLFNKSAEAAR